MNFLPLLGKPLKDDVVVDVLESEDIEVTYDFDRLHENGPDTYWAESKNGGFQFRFDADQILDTVFVYTANIDGFNPISRTDCDILFFSTIGDAEMYGAGRQLTATKGHADFLGVKRKWARLQFENHAVHYEFRGGELVLVTIELKKEQEPG